MMTNKLLARKLEKEGFHYENENYHEVAGMFFALSKAVAMGEFSTSTFNVEHLDGEKIIKWLLDHNWV